MQPLEDVATTSITRRGMDLVANCCRKPDAYLGFSLPTLWGEANMKGRTEEERALTVKCKGCETKHRLPYRLIDRFYDELFVSRSITPPEQQR